MKFFLKRIAIIFGTLSLLFPLIIGLLWYKYVGEQDAFYSADNTDRKACEPFQMQISHESEKMVIHWQTQEACSGFVLLGESYADFSNLPYKVLSAQGESPEKSHVVTVLKQDELQYKYAIIVSDGEWYGINGNPFQFK